MVRIEDIPFSLPLTKKKLTAAMRDIKKRKIDDVGETNYSTQFRKGKTKAVLIYLDVFSEKIKDDIIKSKSNIWQILIIKMVIRYNLCYSRY